MFDFINRIMKNKPDENIVVKPHYTRSETWNDIFNKLKNCPIDDSSSISAVISVNETNFGSYVKRIYKEEIENICLEGQMYVHLYLLRTGVVFLMYCIEEGDHGDEDGFGVEPDTWIFSYVETNGKIIVPFELSKNDFLQAAGKKYGTPFGRYGFC